MQEQKQLTKPHPLLTLISEDSLRTAECSADLQFLIYISHKEKFTKISSASIYTIYSFRGVTKRNDHPCLDTNARQKICPTKIFLHRGNIIMEYIFTHAVKIAIGST